MARTGKAGIKKGDTVMVIAGKDKGKTGKITHVFPEKHRVIVAGINIMKKHERPNPKNEKGGIVEREASLNVSNVLLYSSKENKGVRVGIKGKKDKKIIRVLHKTGEEF